MQFFVGKKTVCDPNIKLKLTYCCPSVSSSLPVCRSARGGDGVGGGGGGDGGSVVGGRGGPG